MKKVIERFFARFHDLATSRWLRPGCVMLAALILWADYLTGPFIRFPLLYGAPVILATWFSGLAWALGIAVAMPLVRVYFSTLWAEPATPMEITFNCAIQIMTFIGLCYMVNKIVVQKRALEKELQILQGILPICSFCKKIRDHDGKWQYIESYISKHSEAEFSHSICPDCAREHYPDMNPYKGGK